MMNSLLTKFILKLYHQKPLFGPQNKGKLMFDPFYKLRGNP
jgi:hypothetical protein